MAGAKFSKKWQTNLFILITKQCIIIKKISTMNNMSTYSIQKPTNIPFTQARRAREETEAQAGKMRKDLLTQKLHIAILLGREETAKALIEQGARVGDAVVGKMTPLEYIVKKRFFSDDLFEALAEKADLRPRNPLGKRVLIHICSNLDMNERHLFWEVIKSSPNLTDDDEYYYRQLEQKIMLHPEEFQKLVDDSLVFETQTENMDGIVS